MQIIQSRRRFLTSLSATGAAGLLGPPGIARRRAAAGSDHDPDPKLQGICIAPLYVADELLRAEGFTDIHYVETRGGAPNVERVARGNIDFSMVFAPPLLIAIDASEPVKVLAGVHSGCFELFAKEPIRTFSELKGRNVGIERLGSSNHVLVAIMAAQVGLDLTRTSTGSPAPAASSWSCSPQGKSMPFSRPRPNRWRCAPEGGWCDPQQYGRRPWSQYFCCMLAGNTDFIHEHPVATKRVLRAALKATDLCASDPWLVSRRPSRTGSLSDMTTRSRR